MFIQPWAFGIGPQELLPILAIALVLFGAKKLPELARGMGEGMREFKKAVKDINTDEEATPSTTAQKTASAETPEEVEKRIVQ